MTDREKLMRSIQICDFAIFEAALFLDTHTKDKDALAYYNKHNMQSMELKEQYTKLYGPLTIFDGNSVGGIQRKDDSCNGSCNGNGNGNSKDIWEWAKGPWPWEYSSDSNGV